MSIADIAEERLGKAPRPERTPPHDILAEQSALGGMLLSKDAVADVIGHRLEVVVCSRVPRGEIVATYGGGGGAVDLAARGAVISPWLRGPQARLRRALRLAGNRP